MEKLSVVLRHQNGGALPVLEEERYTGLQGGGERRIGRRGHYDVHPLGEKGG